MLWISHFNRHLNYMDYCDIWICHSYIHEIGMIRNNILMAIRLSWNANLRFKNIDNFGSTMARFPASSLNLILEYWIEHVTRGLLDVNLCPQLRYMRVAGFASDCICDICYNRFITCFLYVGPLLGNPVLNNNCFVSIHILISHDVLLLYLHLNYFNFTNSVCFCKVLFYSVFIDTVLALSIQTLTKIPNSFTTTWPS